MRWPALRAFNYERIYVRPASLAQSRAVVEVLRALVEYYAEHPALLAEVAGLEPESIDAGSGRRGLRRRDDRPVRVRPVVELLGWDPARLPQGIDSAS